MAQGSFRFLTEMTDFSGFERKYRENMRFFQKMTGKFTVSS